MNTKKDHMVRRNASQIVRSRLDTTASVEHLLFISGAMD
jgi:hypothetical protein